MGGRGGGWCRPRHPQAPARRPLAARLPWSPWEIPPIFRVIRKLGSVPDAEMRKTFNLGIGLVIVTAPQAADRLLKQLAAAGESPVVVGEVVRKG